MLLKNAITGNDPKATEKVISEINAAFSGFGKQLVDAVIGMQRYFYQAGTKTERERIAETRNLLQAIEDPLKASEFKCQELISQTFKDIPEREFVSTGYQLSTEYLKWIVDRVSPVTAFMSAYSDEKRRDAHYKGMALVIGTEAYNKALKANDAKARETQGPTENANFAIFGGNPSVVVDAMRETYKAFQRPAQEWVGTAWNNIRRAVNMKREHIQASQMSREMYSGILNRIENYFSNFSTAYRNSGEVIKAYAGHKGAEWIVDQYAHLMYARVKGLVEPLRKMKASHAAGENPSYEDRISLHSQFNSVIQHTTEYKEWVENKAYLR